MCRKLELKIASQFYTDRHVFYKSAVAEYALEATTLLKMNILIYFLRI